MKTNNTWVDEFREKLDEFGEKHKKYCEKIDELRKENKQILARIVRRIDEKN